MDRWQVEYGNGGWVRVTEDAFDGLLYLRLGSEQGRPVLHELYLDMRESELSARFVRELPIANIVAWVASEAPRLPEHPGQRIPSDWLERTRRYPGPDLSRLASHFATPFSRGASHWVADSMRAQIDDSTVKQAPRGRKPPPFETVEAPPPLCSPEHGLTDAFLRSVAANYAWAARKGQHPAPALAEQAGVSPRTVHGWVSKARDRGIMPPASRGKVS